MYIHMYIQIYIHVPRLNHIERFCLPFWGRFFEVGLPIDCVAPWSVVVGLDSSGSKKDSIQKTGLKVLVESLSFFSEILECVHGQSFFLQLCSQQNPQNLGHGDCNQDVMWRCLEQRWVQSNFIPKNQVSWFQSHLHILIDIVYVCTMLYCIRMYYAYVYIYMYIYRYIFFHYKRIMQVYCTCMCYMCIYLSIFMYMYIYIYIP